MAKLEKKSIDSPDEIRTPDKTKVEVVKVGDVTFGRATFQPGWKWSECVKPVAGTDSCQVHHNTFALSGKIHVVMDDGGELDVKAGDVVVIPAGHDAWVVGDEPFVGFDFSPGFTEYAKGS